MHGAANAKTGEFLEISRLGAFKSCTIFLHPETQVQANTALRAALQSRTQTISTSARCSASQVDYLYLRTKIEALQILTHCEYSQGTCEAHATFINFVAAAVLHCCMFTVVSVWVHCVALGLLVTSFYSALMCFVDLDSVFQSEAEQKFQRPSSPPGGRTPRVLQGFRTDMPVPSQSRWVCQE